MKPRWVSILQLRFMTLLVCALHLPGCVRSLKYQMHKAMARRADSHSDWLSQTATVNKTPPLALATTNCQNHSMASTAEILNEDWRT